MPRRSKFRASGLSLVIAAIVFWNATDIADAIAHLRATKQSVPDAWLAHTSPLSWEHTSFSGDVLWKRAAATADKRRPLDLGQTRVAARPATFSVRPVVSLFKYNFSYALFIAYSITA